MTKLTVVVGLGNPGTRYDETKHNIGFRIVDGLVGSQCTWRKRFDAYIGEASVAGKEVLIIKPQSFMNRSGEPVAAVLKYFRRDREELLVVHDELDLPFGCIRLKVGGGEGGHNGLRSLSSSLGTKNYARLRIGIGRPIHPGMDVSDWVLSNFSREQEGKMTEILSRAETFIAAALTEGVAAAQLRFHTDSESGKSRD